MNEVLVPNPETYFPYKWQIPLYDAVSNGYDRIVAVVHRRGGKDITLLNYIAGAMFRRVGSYYYLFPTFRDGKEIFWDGFTDDGRPYMDFFPDNSFPHKNESELSITARNGSIFHILGTDKKVNIGRGRNPVFCVFSECAYQNPYALEVFSPILLKNKGVAVYLSTPNGKNFFYTMYKTGKRLEKQRGSGWKTFFYTVDDTYDHQNNPLITPEMIQRERDRGMSEELIQQEYYCSFEASHPGAYYAPEMRRVLEQERILKFAIEPSLPVFTFWDFGVRGENATSIWFAQFISNEVHLVDFLSDTGLGLPYYLDKLQTWRGKNGAVWGKHIFPHDGGAKVFQTGKTNYETATELGFDCDVINRPTDLGIAIEAGRQVLSKCWFHEDNCAHGIEGLRQYRRDKDESNSTTDHIVYYKEPVHDWSNHIASAFQTLAQWVQQNIDKKLKKLKRYQGAVIGVDSGNDRWML